MGLLGGGVGERVWGKGCIRELCGEEVLVHGDLWGELCGGLWPNIVG